MKCVVVAEEGEAAPRRELHRFDERGCAHQRSGYSHGAPESSARRRDCATGSCGSCRSPRRCCDMKLKRATRSKCSREGHWQARPVVRAARSRKVIVDRVNIAKKHRSRPRRRCRAASSTRRCRSTSNVGIVCKSCRTDTHRLQVRAGTKVRICRKCGVSLMVARRLTMRLEPASTGDPAQCRPTSVANVMQVPVVKIVVNMGVGKATRNRCSTGRDRSQIITGRSPRHKAKKSIAGSSSR